MRQTSVELRKDPWLCVPDGKQLWFAAAVPFCTTSGSRWRSKTALAFIWDWWCFSAPQAPLKPPAENHGKRTGGLLWAVVGGEHWLSGWHSIFSSCPSSGKGWIIPLVFYLLQRCGVLENLDWRSPTTARWRWDSVLLFCFIIWNSVGRVPDWQLPGFSVWSPKECDLLVCVFSQNNSDPSVSFYLCEERDKIAIHGDIKRLCKH